MLIVYNSLPFIPKNTFTKSLFYNCFCFDENPVKPELLSFFSPFATKRVALLYSCSKTCSHKDILYGNGKPMFSFENFENAEKY